MELVWPALEHLESYKRALEQGWSPNTVRPEAAAEELERIAADPARFIAEQVDRDASGPPVKLPDGSIVQRIPGYRRWMWDGEFAGSIGFRWQPGTNELPPHVLGHIGFSVVPWKRRRGYATQALAMILPDAKAQGLAYVELTTNLDNIASQKVIQANGGRLVGRFRKPDAYGGDEGLLFRIDLALSSS
jgi:predicted acetyltransferase